VGCLNKSWLLLQTFNCKWTTALSILVIILFFSVTLRDVRRAGTLLPLFFQKGGNGGGGNFSSQYHRISWLIRSTVVETNLLQLFTHPQHSEWFSTLSVIIFEVNSVAEQKQTCWWKHFLFIISLHFPQYFYWPLPYRCFGCYLCFM